MFAYNYKPSLLISTLLSTRIEFQCVRSYTLVNFNVQKDISVLILLMYSADSRHHPCKNAVA